MKLTVIALAAALLLPMVAHADVVFLRGDANSDGSVEIGDAVFVLAHLFQGQSGVESCRDAMDLNDDGGIDLTDALHVVYHLFGGGAAPAAPFPACGVDPSADSLDCQQPSPACPAPFDGVRYPTSLQRLSQASTIRFGDVNGDGVLDMAGVLNSQAVVYHYGIALGNGDGTFGTPDFFGFGQTEVADLRFGDLNNDGLVDILAGSLNSLQPFRNIGGGQFAVVTETTLVHRFPDFVYLRDLNGDGNLDVVTRMSPAATDVSGFSVYHGNGDFTFTWIQSVSIGGNAAAQADFEDFNNDGALDLVTASWSGFQALIYLGDGLGGFETTPAATFTATDLGSLLRPTHCHLADLTGDSIKDLLVLDPRCCSGQSNVSVYVGVGSMGSYFQPTGTVYRLQDSGDGSSPGDIAIGDVDGDLDIDVVVNNNAFTQNVILSNDGMGNLTRLGGATGTFQSGASGGNVNLVDVDGDTDLDIVNVVAGGAAIHYNDGLGNFPALTTYPTGDNPEAVRLGDLNGDGHLDAVVALFQTLEVAVHLGAGDGTFGAATTYSVGNSAIDVVIAEFTGDTHLDVLVRLSSGGVDLLAGTGTGTLGAATNFSNADFVYGDVDNDTDLDLFGRSGGHVLVHRNNGNGTFAGPEMVASNLPTLLTFVTVADANGDGWLDVYAGRCCTSWNSTILMNNGSGTLLPGFDCGTPVNGLIADVNGDGVDDVVGTIGGPPHLEVNLGVGDGTFVGPLHTVIGTTSGLVGSAMSTARRFVDIDGDCNLDIVYGTNTEVIVIAHGDGTGHFERFQFHGTSASRTTIPTGGVGTHLVGLDIGDVNGDGLLDLVTADEFQDLLIVIPHVTP